MWTLTSLGVGVGVYIFEVFVLLRLFFVFPLLAVNVVACPIIYFLLVWFVYWLIVSRIFLVYVSICEYKVNRLTNSVGLCECG